MAKKKAPKGFLKGRDVFKLRLGEFGSISDIRKALAKIKCAIGWDTQIMIDNIKLSAERREINLVAITVGDLRFSGDVQIKDIYRRARSIGLMLCPAEVGPLFRLSNSNYCDSYIAMEPIVVRNVERIFYIGYVHSDSFIDERGIETMVEGHPSLSCEHAYRSDRLNFEDEIIFMLPV